jgi:hypothetical protein
LRVYRPRTTPTSDNLGQTQRWLREETYALQQSVDSIRDEFVAGLGYGSLGNGGTGSIPDLSTAWVDYPYNTEERLLPVKTTYDSPAGTLALESTGVWKVSLVMSLTFDGIAARGRNVYLRLFSVTDGAPVGTGAGLQYAVPRDSDAVTVTLGFMMSVGEAAKGDFIVPQISASEAFTGVANDGGLFEVNLVSQYNEGATTSPDGKWAFVV